MHEIRPERVDPPPYVVACLETDPAAVEGHDHVIAIETIDPDGGQTRWRTAEVIAAVRDGERFAIGEEGEGERTTLEPAICLRCPTVTLSVGPGRTEIAPCGSSP